MPPYHFAVRRILLIPAPFVDEGRLIPYVPYGLLSLQAAAQEYDGEAGILALSAISGRVFESSEELAFGIADLVDGEKYGAVGFSTMCSSFHHSLGAAAELRRRYPKLPMWMGGPHASVKPALLLERFPEIDAVFVGEGEETFRDLLGRRREHLDTPLSSLPGVYTRHSPFVAREPIADLDTLPLIDQAPDLLSSVEHSEDASSRGVPLEVERGCPGRCTFCSTRLYWGNRVRYKSAHRLIAEMDGLHAATGKDLFSFIGDDMAASRKRLLAFCETLGREAPDYRWECSLTLDRLRSEDLDLLWESGCRRIFVGVESGSQDTLDRIRKGIDLQRSISLLHEAIDRGFSMHTSFIVGFPWETNSHLRETYNLHTELLKRGVVHSHITSLCPLPGTDLERSEQVDLEGGDSGTAVDGLPYGDETANIMSRCPELFRQLGRFETRYVEPAEVRTIVLAASMFGAYHESREGG